LSKSIEAIHQKGYSQTTMRDIAKATGINLGNLYSYISSKEDILCLAFDTYHGPAMDWFAQEGILDIEDPKEQLRIALHQMLEMIHDVMSDVLMMYRETRVLPPKFLKIVLKKKATSSKSLKALLPGELKKYLQCPGSFFCSQHARLSAFALPPEKLESEKIYP